MTDSGRVSGSHPTGQAQGLGASRIDPARIAADLSPAECKALMHREGGSEACMSWDTGFSLYYRGLTLRNARYQRLTALGKAVRAAIQASAIEAGTATDRAAGVAEGESASDAQKVKP